MQNQTNPNYWRKVKPNDIVSLSDKQALQDSMDKGKGLKPLEFTVKEILRVRDLGEIGEWLFMRLDPGDGGQEIWLVVKIVDTDLALRVYYEPEGFETGNRADMLNRECFWLFQEPADPENIILNELKFTAVIPRNETVDGKEVELSYGVKSPGEIQGICKISPWKSGLAGEMVATLAEYRTEEPTDNPEMMILEVGSEDSDEGGLIRILVGAEIQPTEAEVFPATK